MIKSLRKRHRQVWMAWALLLPIGILFAWLAIPHQPSVKLLQEEQAPLLSQIVQSQSLKNYSINIRSNPDKTKWQLEWLNKTVLTVPSAVIYKTSSTTGTNLLPEDAELIGRIEAKGEYAFDLPGDPFGKYQLNLILYDFIHEKIIERINFQTISIEAK